MSGKVVQIVFSHTWRFIYTWFCCVMTFIVSKCIEYGHKAGAYWTRHHRTGSELWIWCMFIWRQRYFSLEWQMTVTQMTLMTHTAQSGLTTHTNFCTCSPQVYRESQWVITVPPHLTEDSLHSLFMLLFLSINFWWKRQASITPVLGLFEQRTISWPVLQERYLLLAIIVQMRHNQRDILKNYWLT